jgi:Zn-dependent protease
MGSWRHPFEAGALAPTACLALGTASLRLDANERALIRSLRPETRVAWMMTAGSALLSVAAYCELWNVWIAVGLVMGMWVHELGHRAVLRKLQIDSGPILFVPFVGAVQRLHEQPQRALDAALLGLGGPVCSVLFAGSCRLAHLLTDDPSLRFLATAHAILAVIDLLPFGALDGSRVVGALNTRDRIVCTALSTALALACQSLLLFPLCITLLWASLQSAPSHPQPTAATGLLGVIVLALIVV